MSAFFWIVSDFSIFSPPIFTSCITPTTPTDLALLLGFTKSVKIHIFLFRSSGFVYLLPKHTRAGNTLQRFLLFFFNWVISTPILCVAFYPFPCSRLEHFVLRSHLEIGLVHCHSGLLEDQNTIPARNYFRGIIFELNIISWNCGCSQFFTWNTRKKLQFREVKFIFEDIIAKNFSTDHLDIKIYICTIFFFIPKTLVSSQCAAIAL